MHKQLAGGSLVLLLNLLASTYLSASSSYEVVAVSSRPDVVSGEDTLVEVEAPTHPRWNAYLNDRDVTGSFHPTQGSDAQRALLTRLKPGMNRLTILVRGKTRSTLEILDHPLSGPVLSGPHQTPFICQTELNGLGTALDANCSARTVVEYYYKSTNHIQSSASQRTFSTARLLGAGFAPYDPSVPRPSDIAQTVTSEGRTVSYIVRRELGTINRAVYDIQFLHEPGQPLPTPWIRPGSGWNGRLVYTFGAGCGAGYRQGTLLPDFLGDLGVEQEPWLSQGYAVATSTLNFFAINCNDRLSAETLSMVKEHFIERYGKPIRTIGLGGSGGAMQQHLIAQNYPGLLDGLIVFSSFPDRLTSIQRTIDCALLNRAFAASQYAWTEEQKIAVSGFATWRACHNVGLEPPLDPRKCPKELPKEIIYDPVKNSKGARCDLFGNAINNYGRDPRTGLAYRPVDNIGVQYGLAAFNAGKIDAGRFIELNQLIGGFDDDGQAVTTRMTAEPEAIRRAYMSGLVLTGGGDLGLIPIIDWNIYMDLEGDYHDRIEAFITRARLIAAHGQSDNHTIVVDPPLPAATPSNPDPAMTLVALRLATFVRQMDRWLTRAASDHSADPPAVKLSRARPTEVAEGCWQADGRRIAAQERENPPSQCRQLYPPHGYPRLVAGGPLSNDILKCALKPVDAADYASPVTIEQLERLRLVFPDGVCDYAKPGVGQQFTADTWQKWLPAD